MQNHKILTIPKAAKKCGLHRVTLWKYVKAGAVKSFKTPGGQFRIHREDLESFMQQKGIYPFSSDRITTRKILIVDDDPQIQKLLKRAFNGRDYELECASDGFEAGKKISQFKPHLVVLDLFMPKLDGFSVCKQIKTDADTRKIKIIAVSGFNTFENRQKIIDRGADLFLPKPLEIQSLMKSVKDLLDPSWQKPDVVSTG